MLAAKESYLFSHPPDALEVIRKAYNVHQPGRLEESIDRLQEWVEAQPHFNKKDFDRDILEMFIINNKGSVEKAKQRLERHCAVKTFGKKFFSTDVRPVDLVDLNDLYCAPLPALTKDYYRVYMVRNEIEYYGPNVIRSYCIQSIFLLEAMLQYNYSMGMVIIFDWSKAQLKKLLPLVTNEDTFQMMEIFFKGYQMRIQYVHIISTSKLVETILAAVKAFINPKVLGRVIIHKKLEDLYNYVDKDVMPSDYGGKEKSLKEIANEWSKYMSTDERIAYCREMFKATIDDTKKPRAEFNDLFFGMSGTFRKLQID